AVDGAPAILHRPGGELRMALSRITELTRPEGPLVTPPRLYLVGPIAPLMADLAEPELDLDPPVDAEIEWLPDDALLLGGRAPGPHVWTLPALLRGELASVLDPPSAGEDSTPPGRAMRQEIAWPEARIDVPRGEVAAAAIPGRSV